MSVEKKKRSEMKEDKTTRDARGERKRETVRRERGSEGESICRRYWLCPKALASLLVLLLLLIIIISPSHFHSLLLSPSTPQPHPPLYLHLYPSIQPLHVSSPLPFFPYSHFWFHFRSIYIKQQLHKYDLVSKPRKTCGQ